MGQDETMQMKLGREDDRHVLQVIPDNGNAIRSFRKHG